METRYMDKISDKRTIAQKYGDKGVQDRKLKENPKPQSPIPNPQSPNPHILIIIKNKII